MRNMYCVLATQYGHLGVFHPLTIAAKVMIVQQLWDKLPQEIKEEYGDDFVPKGKLPVDLFIEQSWYQQ